jgi:hypothetical protein
MQNKLDLLRNPQPRAEAEKALWTVNSFEDNFNIDRLAIACLNCGLYV